MTGCDSFVVCLISYITLAAACILGYYYNAIIVEQMFDEGTIFSVSGVIG